jgi:O-methyltransferase domain/Dimerisation domain
MHTQAVTPDRLVEIGSGYRRAKALLSAVELDLFTVLGEQPLDEATLAQSLALHPRAARDFFDALVALGLLARSTEGLYSNTPETNTFLNRRGASYLGGMFDQFNTREYGMWNSLIDALRTGKPQTGVETADHFEALYSEPVRFRSFVNAMTAGSLLAAESIAAKFPWADYKTLIDIGTSQGCLPVQVALVHAHISGGGFDLPQMAGTFEQHLRDNGLSERLRFFPGNFFDDPLPAGDVLIFGRILHNWDPTTKQMLLQKAYDALPRKGAVIVYDLLIDDDRRTSVGGLLSSLNMLVWTAAGFGYSGADCMGWMQAIGFRDMRVELLLGGQSMIVGIK